MQVTVDCPHDEQSNGEHVTAKYRQDLMPPSLQAEQASRTLTQNTFTPHLLHLLGSPECLVL